MSASRIILAFLPSFLSKNYQNWWKFDEVLTKTILHSFLRHSVVRAMRSNNQCVLTDKTCLLTRKLLAVRESTLQCHRRRGE